MRCLARIVDNVGYMYGWDHSSLNISLDVLHSGAYKFPYTVPDDTNGVSPAGFLSELSSAVRRNGAQMTSETTHQSEEMSVYEEVSEMSVSSSAVRRY